VRDGAGEMEIWFVFWELERDGNNGAVVIARAGCSRRRGLMMPWVSEKSSTGFVAEFDSEC
jgi:hypothetical protein